MQYSDKQLTERVASLDTFKGWPDGILDVWVRAKGGKPDRFNDKVYTFDCTSGEPKFVMVCTGTSVAGSFGLLKFKTYNPLGCAVLCANQIVYGSHVYGMHKGKPAYRQNKGIPYTRDNDRDLQAENYGKVYNDIIFANCHRAGWFSQVIYNWSVACLVRNRLTEFLNWLKFMNKRPLSIAILSEF